MGKGEGEGDLNVRRASESGSAREESVIETRAGVGGKGGGGRWVFVSHDRIVLPDSSSDIAGMLGMQSAQDDSHEAEYGPGRRNIHFKFEPMVS